MFFPSASPQGIVSPKLGWMEQEGEARRKEKGRARQAGLVATAGKGKQREELEDRAKERGKPKGKDDGEERVEGKQRSTPLQIPLAQLCGEGRVLSPLLIDILLPFPLRKSIQTSERAPTPSYCWKPRTNPQTEYKVVEGLKGRGWRSEVRTRGLGIVGAPLDTDGNSPSPVPHPLPRGRGSVSWAGGESGCLSGHLWQNKSFS